MAELVGKGWDVPYKPVAPTLDGQFEPGEYSPELPVKFGDKTALGHVYWGKVSSANDLTAWVRTAHTKTDFYIAVRVRDDVHSPDDGVLIFLDGDGVANDWIYENEQKPVQSNAEGFVLVVKEATARHNRPDEWDGVYTRTAEGYITEFRIPLAMIDTEDGAGQKPAAPARRLDSSSSSTTGTWGAATPLQS